VGADGFSKNEETLARIYDPFFTTKPHGKGTGLGLSVVHGIMSSHGGVISANSVPGKGTVFRLYFPALDRPADAAVPTLHRFLRGKGERVLYVDDEAALVSLVTRSLRRLGYEVTGYSDAAEALSAFRSTPQRFDVVVTDLSMPGMSGFDLARALLEVRRDVPIVITSGYVRPEDQYTATQLELEALILKPNTIEELAQLLDRLFRDRRNP